MLDRNNLNHSTLCKLLELRISKVCDLSQGWPEGSLFNSYYTEV